jgi:hypothetical protein
MPAPNWRSRSPVRAPPIRLTARGKLDMVRAMIFAQHTGIIICGICIAS